MTAMHIAGQAAFALICLTLLVAPFVPAWREWRRPTDLDALPISHQYTSDIDHFSRRLQADAAARLGQGAATGFEDFDIVSSPGKPIDWAAATRRLIAQGDVVEGGAIRVSQPVYVEGSLRAGPDSTFTALFATGSIDLGVESQVHDWAHANGELRVGRHGVALRRISSRTAIALGDEAWFERMNAPTIRFGALPDDEAPETALADGELAPASYADLPDAVMQTPSLCLVRGDCVLGARLLYLGSLIVTGRLIIGPGTTVIGDIKVRGDMSIGPNASVRGALTCEKRAYFFESARASGPLISEADVLIASGVVIGLPDAPTTVSACNIIIQAGAIVHGSVWAHEIGMVKPA